MRESGGHNCAAVCRAGSLRLSAVVKISWSPGYILFDALLLTVKWSTSSLQMSFGIISAFYRNPALRQLPIEEPDKVSRFP